MATLTVIGLFDRANDAALALRRLKGLGLDDSHFSLISAKGRSEDEIKEEIEDETSETLSHVGDSASKGAGAGAILGGLGGLLAGLGALAIPGVGPVLAAGPLLAALAGAGIGAATGSLIGALTSFGVPHHDAVVFAEGVRRGGVLLIVHSDRAHSDAVQTVLLEAGAGDIETRRRHFIFTGFEGSESPSPSTSRTEDDELAISRDPRDGDRFNGRRVAVYPLNPPH